MSSKRIGLGMIRYLIWEYIRVHFDSNPKKVWEVANEALNRGKANKSGTVKMLAKDGNEVKEGKAVCEVFNEFYANIVGDLTANLDTVEFEHDIEAEKNSMFMMPTDATEIENIIDDLANKANITEDGISNRLVKECKTELIGIITDLVNLSIEEGVFPQICKTAL